MSNDLGKAIPKWNDIAQFFVGRYGLGIRKSVTRITVRVRLDSKRRFLLRVSD